MRWLCGLVVCLFVLGFQTVQAQETKAEEADSSVSVPAGAPLAEGEVIILLQAKVPLEVIQKFVAARGVNFISTKEASKKILAAGGNVALVGTVNLNQREDAVLVDSNGKKKK